MFNEPPLPVIICDIDGTVADLSHRLQYVKYKPKNWSAFFAGVKHDKPRQEIITVVRALMNTGSYVVFVSGRPEQCRADTLDWIARHIDRGLVTDCPERRPVSLLMRADGDYSADDIVKQQLYERLQNVYNMKAHLVIDDRPRVIRMWRKLGIPVMDVGPGVEF